MDETQKFSLKNVHKSTIDCVNGYIRTSQKLFDSHSNPYYNIPKLVNHICILYYFLNEKFILCGEDATICGQNNNEITSKGGKWACAHGNIQIDPHQNDEMLSYEWKFKIKTTKQTNKSCWMLFGITSTKEQLDEFVTNHSDKESTIALHIGVNMIYKPNVMAKEGHESVQAGDTLTMQLDTKKKTLAFYKDDKQINKCIGIETISNNVKQYHMVICICDEHSSLELLTFDIQTT